MKARLATIYFPEEKTPRFEKQSGILRDILSDVAEFLPPSPLGDPLPECDGVVFPEILGEAYRRAEDFRRIGKPILVVTSQFGTFSMWDWEIMDYLRAKGIMTIAPYSIELARIYCRAIAALATMRKSKFLVFQDDPSAGALPEIFRCFYWWEDQCADRLKEKFGITLEKRSLKALGRKSLTYSDADARAQWRKWEYPVAPDFTEQMALNATKLYFAIRDELDSDSIVGVGMNCLSEAASYFSTPCVAWDRLFEERGIIWSCEGDTMTLASKYVAYQSLRRPMMMTNIYPFLMGDAATKHEKIPSFPEILDHPENHILLAHCGYFGLVPRCLSERWTLRRPVLDWLVNKDSHAFDASLRVGPATMTKLDAGLNRMMVIKSRLKGYVQYDDTSDCRNGGIVEVADGKRLLNNVYSHHVIVIEGDVSNELEGIGRIMGIATENF